jgi:hypothetical protein
VAPARTIASTTREVRLLIKAARTDKDQGEGEYRCRLVRARKEPRNRWGCIGAPRISSGIKSIARATEIAVE